VTPEPCVASNALMKRIRALRVRSELYAGLAQGDVITARMTKTLRYVRSITKPAPAELQSSSTNSSTKTMGGAGRLR
jgi:hypothetical protein